MSDPRSNSGDDVSRFEPLPNTMGGADVGDVGDTSAGPGAERSDNGGTSAPGSGAKDKAKDTVYKAKDTIVGGVQQKASAVAGQAGAKASQIGDQATQKADMSKDKAASGLDSLAHTLRDKSQTMGDGQVGSMATKAADKLEFGAEKLRSKDTDQFITDLEALIRKRPIESVVVAAALGFMFARAL